MHLFQIDQTSRNCLLFFDARNGQSLSSLQEKQTWASHIIQIKEEI